jgi:hypothetical protein
MWYSFRVKVGKQGNGFYGFFHIMYAEDLRSAHQGSHVQGGGAVKTLRRITL